MDDTPTGRRPLLLGLGAALLPDWTSIEAVADDLSPPGNLGRRAGLTHGAAAGDVRATRATVWARRADAGEVRVEWDTDPSFADPERASFAVDEGTDFTGTVTLTDLAPGTQYVYRVWGLDRDEAPEGAVRGRFRTAAAPSDDASVAFAFGSCNYGFGHTPMEPPFPVFDAIAAFDPDFFLHLGDTIYADANSPAGWITEETDPDDSLPIYRAKYREMRETNLQTLLPSTGVYTIWDDHEVINNFESSHPLVPHGLRAFHEYWPFDRNPTGEEPTRLYDSFRWGAHLELFVLDTRQYRDPNEEVDEKSVLGEAQRAWLKASLADSDATFKVIATGEPVGRSSNTWVSPRPDWGYQDELRDLLSSLERERVDNVLFLSGDVHHPFVGAYDPDGDGEYEVYEACSSPMGVHVGAREPLYAPLHPETLYNAHGYLNFGVVRVDPEGESLTVDIRDQDGEVRFETTIEARSRTGGDPAVRIESVFEHGVDGWSAFHNGAGVGFVIGHSDSGGNPGGRVGDDDAAGGTWYYRAPFKYRGNKSRFYGGWLTFDLRQPYANRQVETEYRFGDVALRSGSTVVAYDFGDAGENPGTEWTSYAIPLEADGAWYDPERGDPATEATFRAVLADLDGLYVRGEFREDDDASQLDSVALTVPGEAVPFEP